MLFQMNRIQPDNVHSNIFTPREYQVNITTLICTDFIIYIFVIYIGYGWINGVSCKWVGWITDICRWWIMYINLLNQLVGYKYSKRSPHLGLKCGSKASEKPRDILAMKLTALYCPEFFNDLLLKMFIMIIFLSLKQHLVSFLYYLTYSGSILHIDKLYIKISYF